MIPGATGHLSEPLDEHGLPAHAVILLGLDVDHETGERFAAVAEHDARWHMQLRADGVKHYKAHWATRYHWARVPLSDVVFDDPEPSYTARSKAVASLALSLALTHLAGAPWTSEDRLLLGAALAMTSGVQVPLADATDGRRDAGDRRRAGCSPTHDCSDHPPGPCPAPVPEGWRPYA